MLLGGIVVLCEDCLSSFESFLFASYIPFNNLHLLCFALVRRYSPVSEQRFSFLNNCIRMQARNIVYYLFTFLFRNTGTAMLMRYLVKHPAAYSQYQML